MTDVEDHRAVVKQKLMIRTELNLGERFEIKPFSAVCRVVNVAKGNKGIPAQSAALP